MIIFFILAKYTVSASKQDVVQNSIESATMNTSLFEALVQKQPTPKLFCIDYFYSEYDSILFFSITLTIIVILL